MSGKNVCNGHHTHRQRSNIRKSFVTTRIEQRHAKDCAVAVTAMFLSCSYEDAAKLYPADAGTTGVHLPCIAHQLKTKGFPLARWCQWDHTPLPATMAVLETEVRVESLQSHFVLALSDGSVIDPAPGRDDPRRTEDYVVWKALYVPVDPSTDDPVG